MSKRNTLYSTNTILAMCLMGLIAFGTGCAEETKRNAESTEQQKKKEDKSSNLLKLNGKVFSIPSPIQTAYLIKNAGADYRASILNSTDKISGYTTTNKKSLNLGIYGADLGYVTIYDQSQEAISYMAVAKRLTSELGISNLFDKQMIERFESNLGKQDSLLALVSDAFKSADSYLKQNKQEDVSVMILVGGWIETLYFATDLFEPEHDESIRNRIGEQKITLKNVINLLSPYGDDPDVNDLLNGLNELESLYEDINYTYTYKEPITDEENKITKITSESLVEMSPEQLKAISAKVLELRNSIIN